ncbi:hypothetical protein CK203_019998 [Vitis vinifera]|uniref:Uncharacterized protein n=1 Tax=Vitis vinifera TaxID=29760 RepID=A0A438J2R1_VITVI|nr:hypothetical protein CK203_019998 [Vitis vinifera]
MTTEITDVEDARTWRGNIEKIFIDIMAHPNAKIFRLKGCPNYNLLGLIFNPSTTIGGLHYSSTQDSPNINDKDEMDDNLEYGGVHVDVNTEILDDLLRPEMVGGVTTCSGKRATDSLLECRETSRARIETLLARVERYKSGTSSETTSAAVEKFTMPEWRKIFMNMPDERKMTWLDKL